MDKLAFAVLLALVLGGCATKDYVHEYVDGRMTPVAKRLDGVDARDAGQAADIEVLQRRAAAAEASIKVQDGRLAGNEAALEQVSATARQALERANAAGKLAEGRLLYQVSLTDDGLRFASRKSDLSVEARRRLVGFADRLKADNQDVYVEIQGHTDATGEADDNLILGQARAEAVRRFLNMEAGIPLHRLAVISYGEAAPVADNRTVLGRHANRRVVLVVLK